MWCISRLPEQGFRKTECMLAHVQYPFWETSLPLTGIPSVFHILPFTPRKSRKAGGIKILASAEVVFWYRDIGKNRRLMAWSNFGKSWSFQLNKQNYVFLMMEMMCLKEKLTQPGRQEKYIQRIHQRHSGTEKIKEKSQRCFMLASEGQWRQGSWWSL